MTDADAVRAAAAHILDASEALAKHPADLKVAHSALEAALEIVEALQAPPNPYADKTLRPGLSVGEAAARGMIAPPGDGIALTTTPHPEPRDV